MKGSTTIDSLLLIPLDERPISAAYPRLLTDALGWGLASPTPLLGGRKTPADVAGLADWLLAAASGAGASGGASGSPSGRPLGAVIALDTLAWGGLIPSRQSGNDLGGALGRLEVLRRMREAAPGLPILAFSSIQRVSREDDDAEEPSYYRSYGRAIFRRSVLEHRAVADALSAEEARELAGLRAELPAEVWQDQLDIRQRTLAVNLAALDLVADGVIDTLVLNQDDTAEWGLNVMNRRRLEAEVRRRGLDDRVLVYPGADEVAQALIARLASRVIGRRPRVSAFYASRRGADVQTAYEDRPLGDLVTVHLRAAGAVQLPPGAPVDLWLGVNSPSRSQGQGGASHALGYAAEHPGALTEDEQAWLAAAEAPVDGLDRSLPAFRDTLRALLDGPALVALADVAHVNGADDLLMTGLATDGALPLLAGYGGWNTAGNALGSAVTLGCLAALGADRAALELAVAARLVDDWLYQARVRTRLLLQPELKPLGLGGFVPAARQGAVADQARAGLDAESLRFGLPYRVTHLAFPWQRVFEIDYAIERTDERGTERGAAPGGQRAGGAA